MDVIPDRILRHLHEIGVGVRVAVVRRLAVVPARGGSKGIPRKNLQVVAGETLVARAVRCAVASRMFDEVMVSTDDDEVAAAGRAAGAAVPFLRGAAASGDRASSTDVLRDVLGTYAARGMDFDTVALLEPTSPMRISEDVVRSVTATEADGWDAAVTLSQVPLSYHPDKQFRLGEDAAAVFFTEAGPTVVARQQLVPTHIRNGMCYAVRAGSILVGGTIFGTRTRAILVSRPYVNIDSPEDLERARQMLGA
jgi:CMP-N-acetylneuraminic acid synthetase